MKEFIDKLISRLLLESSGCRVYKLINPNIEDITEFNAYKKCIEIVNELAEEYKLFGNSEQVKGGWIPCTVVDHPEHCNDCEVTFKDVRGYGRDIAFYTDKWRRASDEVPILVVAWKEPSEPYTEGE